MKYLASHALALAMVQATPVKRADPQGIDVSDYQPDIDWTTVVDNGISFVYIKATEGTSYISPTFSSQYTGATDAGLIHGGYHFAHPDESDGETQANYFLAHGGGWSADGITLPGALDIEHNPNGAECYGLTAPRWLHGLRISPIHTKLPLAATQSFTPQQIGGLPVLETVPCSPMITRFGSQIGLRLSELSLPVGHTLPSGSTLTLVQTLAMQIPGTVT